MLEKIKLSKKGITLIAIVIAIVVLLILAGITINFLFGKNGLINRTLIAKEKTEQAQLEEKIELYMSNFNIETLTNASFYNGVIDIKDLPFEIDGVKPKLGWIYVENNLITEYELYFENIYFLKTKNDIYVRNYDSTKLINVKDYGAVGDGIVDDTLAIKEATMYLNENGGILYFPIGTYNVSVSGNKENIIALNSNRKVEIDFLKSTIKMTTNGYPNYNIINAENCVEVETRNGILIGDRLSHDYVTINSSHAWGMGMRSTNNTICNILNIEILNMPGDAIYNRNILEGITNINDCTLHHCRRMGITIAGSDVVNIRNTNIQYIGTTDGIEGTAPKSGIDIEPQTENEKINYVSIENVNINNVTNYGIVQNGPNKENVDNIDIVNSKIENFLVGNSANIKKSELINPIAIRKCILEDSYLYRDTGDLTLEDTIVNNCTFEGNDISNGEYDTSFRILPTNTTVTNSIFKNIQGKGNYETNSLAEFGINFAVNWCFTDESSNNVYDSCAIIIDNFTDNNSKFNNSYIYKRGGIETILNKINLNNCTIKADRLPLRFNNCNLEKCYFLGNSNISEIYFTNSSFISNRIDSSNYFSGKYFFDASTINVLEEVDKKAFYNVQFFNNSRIILNKYSDVNLDIPKSTEGIDYIIECNGTDVME